VPRATQPGSAPEGGGDCARFATRGDLHRALPRRRARPRRTLRARGRARGGPLRRLGEHQRGPLAARRRARVSADLRGAGRGRSGGGGSAARAPRPGWAPGGAPPRPTRWRRRARGARPQAGGGVPLVRGRRPLPARRRSRPTGRSAAFRRGAPPTSARVSSPEVSCTTVPSRHLRCTVRSYSS
jgi:hypothetical protein